MPEEEKIEEGAEGAAADEGADVPEESAAEEGSDEGAE